MWAKLVGLAVVLLGLGSVGTYYVMDDGHTCPLTGQPLGGGCPSTGGCPSATDCSSTSDCSSTTGCPSDASPCCAASAAAGDQSVTGKVDATKPAAADQK
jgi:hypothetical protein